MQTKLRRDLRSNDPDRFLTALAVGLMMETNEDPVGWRKSNVQLGEEDWSASYRRAGKSKPIANQALVQALQTAYETAEDDGDALFAYDTGQVTAEMVHDYLGKFKLSVKDLRGFNANHRMHEALTEMRQAGPELPTQKRARTKVLKGEFFKTLDRVAEEVGLEADLIRFSYLDPGLESLYLSDGTLGLTLKTACTWTCSESASRVASRFLAQTAR